MAQALRPGRRRRAGPPRLRDAAHIPPNSTLAYRFRAVLPDGSIAHSPEATVTVADERFDWRSRSDGVVTLHWYDGDDAFADRALGIGSRAIEKAATLLGVTDMPEVDFFVYADQDAFYDALGPGTRENVGGQANSDIRTMFGLITPSRGVAPSWVDTLVSHELTHLVFAEAVDNPYHFPPRWLNEGLAVYLSQGYDASDRATVSQRRGRGTLIPLDGLAGLFPTTRDRFSLAYAESVSAVDFLVRTYGEETLVTLITSYADGVTDDEAFQAALGMSMAAFSDAWMASVGASPAGALRPPGGTAGSRAAPHGRPPRRPDAGPRAARRNPTVRGRARVSSRGSCETSPSRALDTADARGASFADVRVIRRRDESLTVKSGRPDGVSMGESEGFGVRVLVDGAWGFASSQHPGRGRGRPRRGARGAHRTRLRDGPAPPGRARRPAAGAWPLRDARGRGSVRGPRSTSASRRCWSRMPRCAASRESPSRRRSRHAQREWKSYVATDGSETEQVITHVGAGIEANAVDGDELQRRTYPDAGGGYQAAG